MSGDIGLDTLKRQQVRSNESVFAPPEAKAVRFHVPAGSTLKVIYKLAWYLVGGHGMPCPYRNSLGQLLPY